MLVINGGEQRLKMEARRRKEERKMKRKLVKSGKLVEENSRE